MSDDCVKEPAVERIAVDDLNCRADMHDFPMLRHLAQPLDAGRLELDGSVNAARDGVVDDSQLLFGEQLDQITLGLDEAGDVRVLRAQVGDDVVMMGRDGSEEIPCSELAEKAGTITWEIVTRIGVRVRRVYV